MTEGEGSEVDTVRMLAHNCKQTESTVYLSVHDLTLGLETSIWPQSHTCHAWMLVHMRHTVRVFISR